jgi:sporulation protein YlmC with PRC-barrel domain
MQMKTGIVVALAVSMALSLTAGMAAAGVAGTATLGVAVEELKAVALGWSAKKQILDKDVYNDSNEKIGVVEDLIVTPDKAVSYLIVGVGGFLGLDRHDVAIPAGHFKAEGGKLMLPGATKDALKALPKFEYAK